MKKSVMKKIAAVSVCAAVLLTLTACGSSSEPSSATNENGSSNSASLSSGSSAASGNDSSAASGNDSSAASGNNSSAASGNNSSEASGNESAASSAPTETSIPEDTPYTLGGELTPAMIAKSRYNEGNKVRLAKVIKKLQANEEVTVAYIGGSITKGFSAGDDLCYARLTTNWLEEQFPNAKINYVNAGVGATNSIYGVARVDDDVLSKNPDLVFVEFSVNDTSDISEICRETYSGLLKKIWTGSTSPAVVTIATTKEDGTSMQEVHGEIVKKFDIPMISYKNALLSVIENNSITWDDISDDDIHPNVKGHALLSNLITSYLQSVIDDVDNISGEESDFSVDKELGSLYANLNYLKTKNVEAKSLGGFKASENITTSFGGYWSITRKDGQFTDEDAIEFEFEGTDLFLLFVKQSKNGGTADAYIDGNLVKTIDFNADSTTYVATEQVAEGLSEGKHTLRLVPKSQNEVSRLFITALATSK